jgi:tRNA dimethylallyltransferase
VSNEYRPVDNGVRLYYILTVARNLIAVVGPTGTGKGQLALALGAALGGPAAAAVVVCDSVKIYRGADVGTAKIPPAARQGLAFYMVDVADPGERFSAGRYMKAAREACAEIWARGRTAVVVGGTGLYFRALMEGICAAPAADAGTRARLRARAAAGEDLYATLARVDALAAGRVSPADEHRIIRALEVFELTGRPLSALHERKPVPLASDHALVVILDGPRPWLAERLERRTKHIVEAGLADEVRALLARGAPPEKPPLNAIGYRQFVAVSRGEMDEPAATALMTRDTRRLAKRQRTWFKPLAAAARLDASRGTGDLAAVVLELWRA